MKALDSIPNTERKRKEERKQLCVQAPFTVKSGSPVPSHPLVLRGAPGHPVTKEVPLSPPTPKAKEGTHPGPPLSPPASLSIPGGAGDTQEGNTVSLASSPVQAVPLLRSTVGETTLTFPPHLLPELLLLLLQPLLNLLDGHLPPLYLPLVEAGQVLPMGRKGSWQQTQEREHSLWEGKAPSAALRPRYQLT